MNKAIALLFAGLLAVGMTACGERDGSNDNGFRSENVATPNGSVTCILFDGYDSDDIECDFAGARK